MKRHKALAALLAAGLAACGGSAAQAPARGDAVAVRQHNFKLLKTPDPELELALEGILAGAYEAVLKSHSEFFGKGAGVFTYSVSPKGASYPFSEIEVSCLVQERYARGRGPELCGEFFDQLSRRLKTELAAREPRE